jgi:hypothetical protein
MCGFGEVVYEILIFSWFHPVRGRWQVVEFGAVGISVENTAFFQHLVHFLAEAEGDLGLGLGFPDPEFDQSGIRRCGLYCRILRFLGREERDNKGRASLSAVVAKEAWIFSTNPKRS